MLDIETAALTPNALILQLSAVKFSPWEVYEERGITIYDLPSMSLLLSPESQPNRYIDEKNVRWWGKQDQSVQEMIFGDHPRYSLEEAIEALTSFVADSERIWCQGPDVDVSILKDAYASLGKNVPWEYWAVRDSRTLMDIVQVNLRAATHNALDDCFRQICGVQRAFDRLGVTRYIR